MPEISRPSPAVMTLMPPVSRRIAWRKSSAEILRSIATSRMIEFMAASQIGRIFRAFQKVFQDGAFQRRQFGRTAPSRPRDVDGEILRDAAVLDDQHAVGQRHRLGD